jgi:hypothetical protein
MVSKKGIAVDSTLGRMKTDAAGSPVAVAKIDTARSYLDIPELLRAFIDESNTEAWQKIKERIDYTYTSLDHALGALNEEAGLGEKVKQQVKQGKKLFFKPNLVNPQVIDPLTHGEGLGNTACTAWPFIAALMRWFHDKLDISYHEMALGEAASAMSVTANTLSLESKNAVKVTTEAVMEGKCGDLYGGWGFYFVRKYLAETHDASHSDNPMNGYQESVSGEYLPPGEAGNRLMVYDLNRIYDLKSKGRDVPVPDGANYKEITLHKVIVGGDPADPDDIKDYPGCILVNVPKLKVHNQTLLTNALKNLGIGLYPMLAPVEGESKSPRWKYSYPYTLTPVLKTELPHQVWVPEMDEETNLPLRNKDGQYIVRKTAGMPGTIVDVIKATLNQNVLILHVVDAVEAINIDHMGMGMGQKTPEGYVFTSLDPVALDILCARYMVKTIPMQEARKLQKENSLPVDFLQKVPVPGSDGKNIVSEDGFDSSLLRYNLFNYAEKRGLGQQGYYVVGWDAVAGAPLASVEGHLGRVEKDKFTELITPYFYYDPSVLLWGLQKTVLSYIKASDSLTGSSYYQQLMDAFDENGDGVLDYDETGKNGVYTPVMRQMSGAMSLWGEEKYGFLHTSFLSRSSQLRYSDEKWNPGGHNFAKDFRLASTPVIAFMMSQLDMESPDTFFPDITWGKGKWPSLQFASFASTGLAIYGMNFPMGVDLMSLFGMAFQYADKTLNGGSYTGSLERDSDLESANKYVQAVAGGATPLDFTVYIPAGYGKSVGINIPNVEETEDPKMVFTARFNNGQKIW